MHRLLSLLAGAVIAAAFLGPGTITTAARAGAGHGASLLWALVFATVACFLLQEAAARSTLASGQPLAAALRRRYAGGWRGAAVLGLVLAAVIVGCAAYEAGNILGGVAGAEMALGIDRRVLTAVAAVAAAVLLSLGGRATVSAVLAGLVATMGVAFTVTALRLGIDSGEVVRGAVVPTVPVGASLLVLGLVGTTVVPYNLFLGSGLAAGSTEDRRVALRDARLGLAVAIGLGGLVSMAVVLVGSAVDGAFGYAELAAVLADRLGPWAVDLFGWGLFAAGFSSAVTAPWAAAITARGLFADGDDDPAWSDRSPRFRAVWAGVLAFGAVFGLLDVAPIPVILLAQAANGVLLPLVAVVLFLVVNDRRTLGDATNGPIANVLTGAVVVITVALGVRGVLRASATISGRPEIAEAPVAWTATACVVAVVGAWVGREWRAARDPAQGSPSS